MRSEHRLEPCTGCDKPDCGVIVVITNPSVAPPKKQPHRAGDPLHLTCPACGRHFSISILEVDWLEVDANDFARGFLGGQVRTPPRPGAEDEGASKRSEASNSGRVTFRPQIRHC